MNTPIFSKSRVALLCASAIALVCVAAPGASAREVNPWNFPGKLPGTVYYSAYQGDKAPVATTVEPFRGTPLRITYTLPDAFEKGKATTVRVAATYVTATKVADYCVEVPYGPIGCATTGIDTEKTFRQAYGARSAAVRIGVQTQTNSFENGGTEIANSSGKRIVVKPGRTTTAKFKVKFTKCFDWPATASGIPSPLFQDFGTPRQSGHWSNYPCAPAGITISYDSTVRGAKNAAKWTRGRHGTRLSESTGLFNLVSIPIR